MGMLGVGVGVVTSASRSLANTISWLFSANEQGVWLDPSDLSTLFQDTAGTIPVTAAGQQVALMRDKSGRGNHFVQSTALARPTLRVDGSGKWYLEFDGVDDSMRSIASLNLSASDKCTIWAGLRKYSDVRTGIFIETSPSALSISYPGSAAFVIPAADGSTQIGFSPRGSSAIGGRNTTNLAPAPLSIVTSCVFDIAGTSLNTEILPRVNGSVPGLVNAGATIGGGNFGNYVTYIGARAGTSLFFSGRLYGLVVRGGVSGAETIASVEMVLADKTGLTL